MAKQEYMGIQIDTSRDELFDKLGIQRLKESYMTDDEEDGSSLANHINQIFSCYTFIAMRTE